MTEVKYAADKRVVASEAQLAQWAVVEELGGLRARGPCVECKHDFPVLVTADVVSNIAVDEAAIPPEERTTRRFACACLSDHADRPATVPAGCGRWWLASVVRDSAGTRKLIPAPDDSLAGAATALDQATRDEVTAVRAWGEKWLPAVAALYGLFGLAGIVFGKDAFESVPTEGRVVAALAILGGLVCTAAAVWFGYRAAFGWMKVKSVETDVELAEWYRQRRSAVVSAPAQLQTSLVAAIGALALLLVAVGVIWFWPSSGPASPLVEVAYNADENAATPAAVCGKLLESANGTVTVQTTVDGQKQSVLIAAPWVQSITPKASC